jgi:hypothetical protein
MTRCRHGLTTGALASILANILDREIDTAISRSRSLHAIPPLAVAPASTGCHR